MKELTIPGENFILDESDVIQLVGMKLGEEEYAIDVLKIQEIIRTVEITIVPRSDGYVLGVMNLRGRVIPVVDLRVRFSLDKMDFDKDTRIIVVRFEKEQIGFVVDEVTQVIRISKSMVEPTPPLVGAVGQEYILGICKYQNRLIILLDIDRVVTKPGATLSDSALRQKFLLADNKPKKRIPSAKQDAGSSKAAAKEAAQKEAANNYSMADEVDAANKPLITVADEHDDNINDVLADAVKQSNNLTKTTDENTIHQHELDSLIAAELKKREAETDELNKRRKEVQKSAAAPADEEALSIDELIALELKKREAETEELNKKRSSESDKKKTDLTNLGIQGAGGVGEVEQAAKRGAGGTAGGVQGAGGASSGGQAAGQVAEGAELGAGLLAEQATEESSEEEKRESSLAELKEVARKIINGESNELDLDMKGEVGELIRLLVDIKGKVDEISPTVLSSQRALPGVSSVLTDVDTTTNKAAIDLLESAQKMSEFYQMLQSQMNNLDKAVKQEDAALFNEEVEDVEAQIDEAGKLGLNILEALEFQDITEQKLRKVLGSIEDVGARLGVIVGYIKANDGNNEEYDHVLTDLGFA